MPTVVAYPICTREVAYPLLQKGLQSTGSDKQRISKHLKCSLIRSAPSASLAESCHGKRPNTYQNYFFDFSTSNSSPSIPVRPLEPQLIFSKIPKDARQKYRRFRGVSPACPPPVTGRSASLRLRFRFVRVVRAVRAGEAKLRGRMQTVILIAGPPGCEYPRVLFRFPGALSLSCCAQAHGF